MKTFSDHQTLGKRVNRPIITNSSKDDYPGEIFGERKNLIWKEKQNLLHHFQMKSVRNFIICISHCLHFS